MLEGAFIFLVLLMRTKIICLIKFEHFSEKLIYILFAWINIIGFSTDT